MTPSFQIVTVTNRWPDEVAYFCHREWLKSLQRHNVQPEILGLGMEWKGLMSKPRVLRHWLTAGFCKAGCLIVCDSWDLVFAAHPDAIVAHWEAIGRPWLIGGERSLFPAGDEARYPKCASSHRFPNSGFIISTPGDMLKVLEHMNLDAIPDDGQDPANPCPNDQFYYQQAFLDQPIPMRVDTECQFVWNLCGVDASNLELYDVHMSDGPDHKRVFNRETHTFPTCIHFNGGSKTDGLQEPILKHLGLRP